MKSVQENHYPVSFSIGVITFLALPVSLDQMLDQADQLMYEVKNSGKNNLKFNVFYHKGSAITERRMKK